MLNWDEYGKDENSTPPVVSEPKTEVVNQTAGVRQPEPPQPAESAVSTDCLLYTSPSPRDATLSRMPSSA